jgi:hypothetical protein
MRNPAIGAANGAVLTVEAAGAANLGADVLVFAEGATATVVCAAGFGGLGGEDDPLSLVSGDMAHIYSDGVNWWQLSTLTAT